MNGRTGDGCPPQSACSHYDGGPDILPMIDKAEKGRIEQAICRRIEWKKEPRYQGDN